MARKAIIDKCKKAQEKAERAFKDGRKIKFPTKLYNRCSICWRPRGYVGKFGMCRICIREKANAWELMWVRKSSW